MTPKKWTTIGLGILIVIMILLWAVIIVRIIQAVIKKLIAPKKTIRVTPKLSKEGLMRAADDESGTGKGGIGNWGDNQIMLIQYLISASLLETQSKLSGKKMDIYEFVHTINHCLTCITQNFAAKYSYSDVLDRVNTEGRDKDFDKWFRDLYTTCDCNDKLGQLLVKLLKEFWVEKSALTCPDTKSLMSECISRIQIQHFEQGMVDQVYKMLESCIEAHCPQLLSQQS